VVTDQVRMPAVADHHRGCSFLRGLHLDSACGLAFHE
jgi:hypothetical protein